MTTDATPAVPRSLFARLMVIRKQASARAKADNLSLISAGVAFYAMLAIFPSIIGMVSVYALVADPHDIRSQLDPVIRALPPGGGELLVNQLTGAVESGRDGLTFGVVISLLATVWAASGGVRALMTGLNVINRRPETRGFLKLRALAVGLTVGALLIAAVVIGLVAAFPVLLGHIGLGPVAKLFAQVGRWVALFLVAAIALGLFYRYAPVGKAKDRWRWVSGGVIAAIGIWLLGSVGFSLYVSHFSSYNKTYGALAAVIVLLLWLFLSAYAVLFGAEVDAVGEGSEPTESAAVTTSPS